MYNVVVITTPDPVYCQSLKNFLNHSILENRKQIILKSRFTLRLLELNKDR